MTKQKKLPKQTPRKGPNIIPNVIGIIRGERIELKKGAPTDILLLKITLEKRG